MFTRLAFDRIVCMPSPPPCVPIISSARAHITLHEAPFTCEATFTCRKQLEEHTMATRDETTPRTRWGRTKFARRTPAMAFAIPLGLVVAGGFGALTLLTDFSANGDPLLVAGVTALVMAWGCIGLVWALIVDRTTLHGAVEKPDQTVEARWMTSAQSGALTDLVTVVGLAIAILAFTRVQMDGMWILIGVLFVAGLSVGARYIVARTRG